MSELASYSIQAIFFALVAVVVVSRSKKTDLYQFALISIWLIGVIVIYARYKDDQVLFYSNDQLFHFRVIDYYLPQEGLSFEGIIGLVSAYRSCVSCFASWIQCDARHQVLTTQRASSCVQPIKKVYVGSIFNIEILATSTHCRSDLDIHVPALSERRDTCIFRPSICHFK